MCSVVREVLQKRGPDMRLQSQALDCLRESTEDFITQLFEEANLACFHRSRVTVDTKDVRLVQSIRSMSAGARPN